MPFDSVGLLVFVGVLAMLLWFLFLVTIIVYCLSCFDYRSILLLFLFCSYRLCTISLINCFIFFIVFFSVLEFASLETWIPRKHPLDFHEVVVRSTYNVSSPDPTCGGFHLICFCCCFCPMKCGW